MIVFVPMLRWLTVLLIAIASLPAHAQRTLSVAPSSGQRVALVIGNDTYRTVRALDNARADARAMAQALEQAGFRVTLRLDVTRSELLNAVRIFKGQLSGGSEAVFYFAGHGVQLGAANYLLPVDIVADNEEQVKDDGLPLQRVLDDITEQKARFSLAIIDACRDNPFPRVAGRSIGGTRGLAPTSAATGQMVIYSAGTGQMALDKLNAADRNPNGLFTRVFLQEMQRPGLAVDRVLRNVRDQVVTMARAVGHEQVPALYDQAIGEFYFRPPGVVAPSVANLAPAIPVADPASGERAFWDSVKDTKNPNELKAYLGQYPQGLFVSLAQERLRGLTSMASETVTQVAAASAAKPALGQNPRVELRTNRGAILIELYADKAPRSVANFLEYAKSGFYNGTIFHRVIDGFMIQGGGFTADMQQKSTRSPIENEATNRLPNDAGTLAMARTSVVNSATSQFFINLKDNSFLNHRDTSAQGYGYAVFGRVVQGMDIVRAIAQVATGTSGPHQNVPREPVLIQSVTIR